MARCVCRRVFIILSVKLHNAQYSQPVVNQDLKLTVIGHTLTLFALLFFLFRMFNNAHHSRDINVNITIGKFAGEFDIGMKVTVLKQIPDFFGIMSG
jgi:hypothetical protein